ncbi:hypothetical protein [Micrococcus luteus]|uniref:hypothetical protein n=1 Tax=Micrococcus luteus TaxID=1270 RepID=UPI003EB7D24C
MAENPEDLIVTDAELRRQLPALAKELKIGGSGVEPVSGTVTLDVSGDPIREFFTTGATTFKANGVSTLISSFTAVVWRRDGAGKWAYLTVDSWKDTAAPVPDTTKPIPGWLTISEVSDTSFKVVHEGATDNVGVTGYRFSVDNAATWSAWQTAPTFTATGRAPSTDYAVLSEVRDAAGNTARTGVTTVRTTATPVLPLNAVDYFLYPNGTSLTTAGGPIKWLAPTMQENQAGGATATVLSTMAASGTTPTAQAGASVEVSQDDAEITVRRDTGRVWLFARGGAAKVWVSADMASLVAENGGTVALPAIWSTLTLRVVGATGEAFVDGTKVLDVPVGATMSNRWGWYRSLVGSVLAAKITPATASSPAPTIGYGHEGLTAVESFSGADAATVTDRAINSATGTFVTAWDGRAMNGWSSPAIGVASGVATLVGSGARFSPTVFKAPKVRMTTTLASPPTAGEVYLTLGHLEADPGPLVAPRVAINSTRAAVSVPGVTAVDLATGVQAGDKFTIERNNDTFRFGLTRGGAEIATKTMTVPAGSLPKLGFRTGVGAASGATGATFDDMKWEAL